MTIDGSAAVVGVTPRISQAAFATILRDRGSHAANQAGDGWIAVEQHDVDPDFALAVFHQESQFATDTASATSQVGLRNPGHTRTSRIGVGVPIDTPWEPFVRYPSRSEGWRDLAFRLGDCAFFYAQQGRRSIRPILALWAPPNDNFDDQGFSNTDVYVRNLIRNMTDWADLLDGGTPVEEGTTSCPSFPPPVFNGRDTQVGDVVFHAAAQAVEVATDDLPCRQFAFDGSCETRRHLRTGDTFDALYWVEGENILGENRWWVATDGARLHIGGTVEKPQGLSCSCL